MTDEQLAVIQSHVDWHNNKFGEDCSNVAFAMGYIEKLGIRGLEPRCEGYGQAACL